jgi:hypothetical protein
MKMKMCLFAAMISISAVNTAAAFDSEPAWRFGGGGVEWDSANNPANFGRTYEYRFNALPLNGTLSQDKIPWSETYWPSLKGSIAFRWQTNQKADDYGTYSREQLLRMSPEQIARLSPAEKYDILMGRYDYPTVSNGRWIASRAMETWRGLCHGWTPASLQHREPAPVTLRNADGIEIRFGSSDVKGLLTFYYAFHADNADVRFVGSACKIWGRLCGAGDVNAGAFHVVLANQLGILNEGFGLDKDSGRQVWNQPVYAFKSKILEQSGNRILVESEVTWAYDGQYTDNFSQWEPVTGTANYKSETETYKYYLVLDSQGRIIGGEWMSQNPDFLWIHSKVNTFTGDYRGLNEIYKPMN